MTHAEIIRTLTADYTRQREENERARDARRAEAICRDPKIAELLEEKNALAFASIKKALAKKTDAATIGREMRDRGLLLNAEIRRRLQAVGLPENQLDMQYRCAICQDSGYTDTVPARFCACFEKRMREMAFTDESMSGLNEQNFAAFDAAVFPADVQNDAGKTQRDWTCAARDFCEIYANDYPDTKKLNLVLTGASGLGKTFLLNCIAERVMTNGHDPVRITAYRLLEAMRDVHFHTEGREDDFDRLIETPLLLIDDLGSEPMLRNITQEYLFLLMNERTNRKKHTVIATNLSPVQLAERYGERVSSRILDKRNGDVIRFFGKDLRKL